MSIGQEQLQHLKACGYLRIYRDTLSMSTMGGFPVLSQWIEAHQ
jgi:hypothetical protein